MAGSVASIAPAAPPSHRSVKVSVAQLEARIVALTNVERKKRGLAPLAAEDTLRRAAFEHSDEMIRLDYFAHESPTDGMHSPAERIAVAGCTDVEVGENIAFYQGFTVEHAARRLVTDWMNSPGHRANILRPSYTCIGIGIAYNSRKIMISQEFSGRRLSFDSLRETLDGSDIVVRLSGRTMRPASEIAVFDGDAPVHRAQVDARGRFTAVVRLKASSGRHTLNVGTLAGSSPSQSSFDIYSVVRIDTDRVAAR